jgi:hypothetical protein
MSHNSYKALNSEQGTCWKHCMTIPSMTRLKFCERPPVKSSRRENGVVSRVFLSDTVPVPVLILPPSIATASLIAWNVRRTSVSEIGLSSKAEMTAIASAGRFALRSLSV